MDPNCPLRIIIDSTFNILVHFRQNQIKSSYGKRKLNIVGLALKNLFSELSVYVNK